MTTTQKDELCGACNGVGTVDTEICKRCAGHGFFYQHGCGATYTLELFRGLAFAYEEFWKPGEPILPPRMEFRHCVCRSTIGIGTDVNGNWVREKDWLEAHKRRKIRKLTGIRLECVSIVSRCPFCGSYKWDEDFEMPTGTICKHPTKFSSKSGLGVAGRICANDD